MAQQLCQCRSPGLLKITVSGHATIAQYFLHYTEMRSTRMPVCMGRFIQADLQAVDRRLTPWVVVNQHRPIYTSSVFGRDHQSDIVVATDLRNAMEDLFFLYQVAPPPAIMLLDCSCC